MARRSVSTWWTPISSKTKLRVGRLLKAHGLKGAIKLELYTDSPNERFVPGAELELQVPTESPWHGKALKVAELRWYNQSPVIFLEGIEDRTAAESLIKAILLVNTDAAALPAEPDAWYDHQLVGLRVVRDGVKPGEQIIVNGLQRVRPGAPIIHERFHTNLIGAFTDNAPGLIQHGTVTTLPSVVGTVAGLAVGGPVGAAVAPAHSGPVVAVGRRHVEPHRLVQAWRLLPVMASIVRQQRCDLRSARCRMQFRAPSRA